VAHLHCGTVVAPCANSLAVGRLLRPSRRRIFEIFLAPVGCRVEKHVGVGEILSSAGVGRVSVKHLVVEAEENAQAVLFAVSEISFGFPRIQFRFAPVVVLRRRLFLIQCDMKIVIGISSERRVPRNAPAFLGLVRFEFVDWRTRNDDERCVAKVPDP